MNQVEAFRTIQLLIAKKQAEKPVMEEHNTAENTAGMIVDEAEELRVAMLEVMVTNEVWTVASELADVLYLSLYLCELCGLNAGELIELKMQRNDLKYPAVELQEGEYHQIAGRLKREWADQGGDQAWTESLLSIPEVEDPTN